MTDSIFHLRPRLFETRLISFADLDNYAVATHGLARLRVTTHRSVAELPDLAYLAVSHRLLVSPRLAAHLSLRSAGPVDAELADGTVRSDVLMLLQPETLADVEVAENGIDFGTPQRPSILRPRLHARLPRSWPLIFKAASPVDVGYFCSAKFLSLADAVGFDLMVDRVPCPVVAC